MSGLSSPGCTNWNTQKCRRVLRPLSSKLQALKSLVEAHPSLLTQAHSAPGQKSSSFNSKKYYSSSSSSSFSSSLRDSTAPKLTASNEHSSRFRSDTLFLALHDKISPEIFALYRSIYHAFRHFLTQAYLPARSLAQKSAVEVGKCIVYTMDSFSEDEWYDCLVQLRLYKRFIAIGHGASLVAQEAVLCRELLPALVAACAEFEAYDIVSVVVFLLL
ncbi:hypothetical protein BZA70DRAFT_162359 [Myxozyma melibiosi]|uniref:Uncharacterized protein n=1 Tax=Myxozyma melibiosi TaxID=54550 RepID=A0ABR1F6S0_9ASCO